MMPAITAAIATTSKTGMKIPSPIAKGNQSGEVTHHHDQPITPHNFNTKNMKNNIPVNPIPPLPAAAAVDVATIRFLFRLIVRF